MADLPTPAEAAERVRRETVEAWVAAHPEWSLRQMGAAWGCEASTVLRWYNAYGIVKPATGWRKGSE